MVDWITVLIGATGGWGIALLMFAENVFPPIPSELIMPFAGFAAAQGDLSLGVVIAAGTVGSLLGVHVWFEIGRVLGAERLRRWASRHGRWLTLTPHDVDAARAWFDRHGAIAVLLGRLVPTVRTLISVPAGIVRMRRPRFLLFSAVGTATWTGLLATLGYLLEGRYVRVVEWVDPLANGVVATLLALYLYRVATFDPSSS